MNLASRSVGIFVRGSSRPRNAHSLGKGRRQAIVVSLGRTFYIFTVVMVVFLRTTTIIVIANAAVEVGETITNHACACLLDKRATLAFCWLAMAGTTLILL